MLRKIKKEKTGAGGLFIIMLIIALIIDALSAFLGLAELITGGGIPFISSFINFIGTTVIGTWLYFRKKKELQTNLAQRVLARLGISSLVELIPIINVFTPTWTINVLSVLEYRRILYLLIIGGFILLPIILIVLYQYLMPEEAVAGGGHSIEYPEDAERQKMIDCINNYIAQSAPSSPYRGMGEDFVKAGEQYGIHPGYIVAMARKESSLCTDKAAGFLCFPTDAENSPCFNAWGRKKSKENPSCGKEGNWWTKYPDWKQGIYRHTEFIKKDYFDKGKKTIEDITPIYCPPNECDTNGYINWMISESEKAAGTPLKTMGGFSGPIAQRAIEIAKSQLGVPYEAGTDGKCRYPNYDRCPPNTDDKPKSHDCSQFTGWVYYWATDGKLNMPSYTLDQVKYCDQIPAGQEQPGDLVFFETCSPTNVDSNHHVGMIVEPGKYIHAPHTGEVVQISDLSKRRNGYCICRIKQEYLQ